jgi:hypothetical protein
MATRVKGTSTKPPRKDQRSSSLRQAGPSRQLTNSNAQHHEMTPPMTSISALLTRKRDYLSRLDEYPGPKEREEIERLLGKIDAELNAVDSPDRL